MPNLSINEPFKIEGMGDRLFNRGRSGLTEFPNNDTKRELLAGTADYGGYTGKELKTLSQQEVGQLLTNITQSSGGRYASIRNETGIGPSNIIFDEKEAARKGIQGPTAETFLADPSASSAQGAPGASSQFIFKPTEAYSSLPKDQQDAIRSVVEAIAENDQQRASQLQAAFEAASAMADPYFKQQIRLVSDELKRGFVSIENDLEFKEQQAANRLKDLREDVTNTKEFLDLEQSAQLRAIEREYEQTLDTTRQNMAALGFTSSTRRAKTEELLAETTGDLRESTSRRFGAQLTEAENTLTRGERDVTAETERLKQLAEENKLDLLRRGEEQLGTKDLPDLNTNLQPLGDVVGSINQRKMEDILQGTTGLIF